MNEQYYSILKTVFLYRCSFILVLLIIGTVTNTVYLLCLKSQMQKQCSGRKRQRILDFEKRKRNCISQYMLGLTGIVLLFSIWALPPLQDANEDMIIHCEAIYHRRDVDMRTGIPNVGGDVQLTVNQDSFSVELYPGFSEKDFPTGRYQAVVWYGSNCKILLDIILLEENGQFLTK